MRTSQLEEQLAMSIQQTAELKAKVLRPQEMDLGDVECFNNSLTSSRASHLP